MKKTIVLYPPGCYGSFVTWLLKNVNVPVDEIKLPFQKDGSSHDRMAIFTHSKITNYLDPTAMDSNAFPTGNTVSPSIYSTNLEQLLTIDDIVQFHYPDDAQSWHALMKIFTNYKKYNIINIGFNFYSKLWLTNNIEDKMANNITRNEEFLTLLAGWGTPPYDAWQIRECLSCHFYLFENHMNNWMSSIRNAMQMRPDVGFYLDILELRDNFEETIKRLCDFCNIKYSGDTIDYIKTQWFLSQKHLFKDSIVDGIVNNIVNNKDFVITDQLSIIDEAHVQQKLRDQGIELKCYNLNEFPKTNAEFQELLYYNFDTLITNNFNDIVRKFYNKQISHDDTLSQLSNILKKLDD
jgi:hypothetical protein